MKILLVEPDYYTKYPPLGLLKLASYHRSLGDDVRLVHGCDRVDGFIPDIIEVTSLFTYAWRPVHESISFYEKEYPEAQTRVGGIYASLMPRHLKSHFPHLKIYHGLFKEAEKYLPAYDLLVASDRWKDWNSTILFTSRGCIRRCPFCVVPRIEGKIESYAQNVRSLIYEGFRNVTLWDNNFLASPDWKKVVKILQDMDLTIDFNQGLDARLINDEVASMISSLHMPMIRMAYDVPSEKEAIVKAVNLLAHYGVKKRKIIFYVLHNFYDPKKGKGDNPKDFLKRIQTIAELGCSSYPMRYIPPNSLEKNSFVSSLWSMDQLDAIAKARRVIGYGGAFPPYEGLVRKFTEAGTFEEAFGLRPATCG